MIKKIILMLSFLIIMSLGVCATLDNNIVAYYKFDGDVTDYTGDYNGSIHGSLSYKADGFINGAYKGDGSTAYINTTISGFNHKYTSWSFWINTTDTTDGQTILGSYSGDGAKLYQISLKDRGGTSTPDIEIYARTSNGNLHIGYVIDPSIYDGSWHHIVVIFNDTDAAIGSAFQVYIDNSSQTVNLYTKSGTVSDFQVVYDIWLFGQNNAGSINNAGAMMLDEVGFWNITLSSAQVSTLFNSGAGNQPPFNSSPPTPSNITNTTLTNPANYSIISNITIPTFNWTRQAPNATNFTYYIEIFDNSTGNLYYNASAGHNLSIVPPRANISNDAWNKWRVVAYNNSNIFYVTPFSYFFIGFMQNSSTQTVAAIQEFNTRRFNLSVDWDGTNANNISARLYYDGDYYNATLDTFSNVTKNAKLYVDTYHNLIEKNHTNISFRWYYTIHTIDGLDREYWINDSQFIDFNQNILTFNTDNNTVVESNTYGYYLQTSYPVGEITHTNIKAKFNGTSITELGLDSTTTGINTTNLYTMAYTYPLINTNQNLTFDYKINLSYAPDNINSSRNISFTVELLNNDIYLCNASYPHHIINISYLDAVDNGAIAVNSSFLISFYDGIRTQNIGANWSTVQNNTFCTNLDPAKQAYDWNMEGLITLTKGGYVTNVYDLEDGVGLTVSNDPTTLQNPYMVAINDSQTITFTVRTTDFQAVTGTLRIYKCGIGNTRALVNSVPILSGTASANIILLTQSYSYEIVYNDRVYQQDSFYKCHIESTNERTIILSLVDIPIAPVIPIYMIDCTIEKTGNNTVKMQWRNNDPNAGTIQACIIGYRATAAGYVEIYRNCSNDQEGTLIRTIPDNGNSYFVNGEIFYGDIKGMCRDTVYFEKGDTANDAFGVTSLLLTAILIISCSLLFAGDTTKSNIAGLAGFGLSYMLGFFTQSWIISSAIITFALIITFIARGAKLQKN